MYKRVQQVKTLMFSTSRPALESDSLSAKTAQPHALDTLLEMFAEIGIKRQADIRLLAAIVNIFMLNCA